MSDLETIYDVILPVKGYEIYQVVASSKEEALGKFWENNYLSKEVDLYSYEKNGDSIYVVDTNIKGEPN